MNKVRLVTFKKNALTIAALLFSTVCIFGTSLLTHVSADSVDVHLNVEGCNNNYICEAVIGEDINSCPNDCTPVVPTPPTLDDDENNSGSSGSKIENEEAAFNIFIDSIITTPSTIKIIWKTSAPTMGSLTWSNGSGFNLGSLQEVGYTTTHTLVLNNLLADTSYSIALTATDLEGLSRVYNLNATTEKITIVFEPVTDFFVSPRDSGVILSWKNPPTDFEYVRIVRSDDFFPGTPYEGEVIYEGSAQSYFDSEIESDVRYYYSIFVKGKNGFSPGVLQNFIRNNERDLFEDVGEPITIFGPIYDSTVISDLDQSDIESLFHVYQDGIEVSRANNIFYVKNGRDIVMTVDKSLAIPSDSQVFVSYLRASQGSDGYRYSLEYNEKERKFITTFKVQNSEINTPFILYIRNNQQVSGYVGYLNTETTFTTENQDKSVFGLLKNDFVVSLMYVLLFILFIIGLWYFFVLKKKENHLET